MSLYTYFTGFNPEYLKILKSINCYASNIDMDKNGYEIKKLRDLYVEGDKITVLTRGYDEESNKLLRLNPFYVKFIPFMTDGNYLKIEFKLKNNFQPYAKDMLVSRNHPLKRRLDDALIRAMNDDLTEEILKYMPVTITFEKMANGYDMKTIIKDIEDIVKVAKNNGYLI